METKIMLAVLIGILVAGIIYLIVLYRKGKEKEILSIVKAFVDEAEVKFGSGTGALKYEYVVGKLYTALPGYIKVFVSDKLIDSWIKVAVDELQELLEEKINEEEEAK